MCRPLGFHLRLSHIPAVDFPAAAGGPQEDFTPQTLPFKKRERERKTSPVVSVRCVSSRRGSGKISLRERERGRERERLEEGYRESVREEEEEGVSALK